MTLGLTAEALHGQWWQLWTCHVVHWDVRHLMLNAVAAMPTLLAAPRRIRLAAVAMAFWVAPLLSLAVLAAGIGGEYRGASGLIVAIWVFTGAMLLEGGHRWSGGGLLACIAAKLAFEAFHGMPASATFQTLSLVHYAGGVVGLISGLGARLMRFNCGGEPCF